MTKALLLTIALLAAAPASAAIDPFRFAVEYCALRRAGVPANPAGSAAMDRAWLHGVPDPKVPRSYGPAPASVVLAVQEVSQMCPDPL